MANIFSCKKYAAALAAFALLVPGSAYAAEAEYDYIVNEENFGVIPNDNESDRAGIQRALDKALEAEGETTVYIPSGTYHLDRALYIYSNTRLVLADDAVIVRDNEADAMILSRVYEEIGGYGQYENITIEGGVWDGNVNNADGQGVIMRFYHGRNLTIKNTTVKESSARHIVIVAGVENCLIDNVNFESQIEFKGTENVDEYFIPDKNGEVNKFSNFRCMEALHIDCINEDGETEFGALPFDNTANKNVTVQNCTFKDVYSGLGNHCTYNPIMSEKFIVKDNTFTNVKYTCVDVFGTVGAELTNNKTDKVGEFARVEVSDDVVISGTVVNVAKNPDYMLFGAGIFNSTAAISDFTVNNSNDSGIFISNSKLSKLENIEITNPAGNGIVAYEKSDLPGMKNITVTGAQICGIFARDCENVEVEKLIAKDCKDSGFSTVSCKNSVITNSKISNSPQFAISVINNDNTKYTGLITDNEISKCGVGLNLFGTTFADLTDNSMEEIGVIGINVRDKSVVTNLCDNIVTGAVDTAIYVAGASEIGKIENNTLSDPGVDGIDIKEKSKVSSCANNTISNCGKYGLYVTDSSVSFDKNTINKTKDHGIVVIDNSDVKITGNDVLNSQKSGVYLEKSKVELKDNNILQPVGVGIGINQLTGSAGDKMVISGNKVVGSGDIGIFVDASKYLDIDSNSVSDSKMQSIKFQKSGNITASNNEFTNSGKHGVLISSSTVLLDNNKINKTTEHGILVNDGSDATITGNDLVSVAKTGIYIEKSNAEVKNNSIFKPTGVGIGVNLATGEAKNKTVISGNKVVGSGSMGIFVDNSNYLDVDNNDVSDSTLQGIKVQQSDKVDLSNNDVENSGKHGILLDASDSSSLVSNMLSGSKEYGIYITSCIDITISTNATYDNDKQDLVLNNGTSGVVKNNYTSDGKVELWGGSDTGVTLSGTKVYIGFCSISSIVAQSYTGKAITPSVKITNGSTTLTKDVDYTLSYKDNVNIGVGVVVVTGKGEYGGAYEVPFEIVFKSGNALTIPSGTEIIAAETYKGNKNIKYILIPASVTKIEKDAFAGCTAITNVYYTGSEDAWKKIDIESGNEILEKKLTCDYYDGFVDVNINNWFTPYVQRAYKLGIITGLTASEFAPNDPLTRAMAVTILYRAAGSPSIPYAPLDFPDVPNSASKWYFTPIQWAKETGIVSGYTKGDKAGQFGRTDNISRQDFALIMYRYVQFMGGDVTVTDTESYKAASDWASVSSYARTAVMWAYNNGIMGVGSDLNPKGEVKRSETATIVMRVIDFLAK